MPTFGARPLAAALASTSLLGPLVSIPTQPGIHGDGSKLPSCGSNPLKRQQAPQLPKNVQSPRGQCLALTLAHEGPSGLPKSHLKLYCALVLSGLGRARSHRLRWTLGL